MLLTIALERSPATDLGHLLHKHPGRQAAQIFPLGFGQARVHYGEVLRDVTEQGTTVVVERRRKPQAVVISLREYRRLKSGQIEKPHWKALLEEAHDQIRREGNLPLIPSPEELIREERDRRGEQILDSLH